MRLDLFSNGQIVMRNFKIHNLKRENLTILYFFVFIIYLSLRIASWHNTVLLEDTDSLFYLGNIKDLLSLDYKKIIGLSPDFTPFYPFFGALLSLPGWSVETGGRLASFFFGFLLFWAVLGIGRKIADQRSIILGLLILSFNHVLIPLSFSVLTEPSYIATVYFGLWLFLKQYRVLKLWQGAILGAIFGLCFLNRTEGIIYLAVIPFFQGVHFVFENKGQYNLKRLIGWGLLFLIFFLLFAVPQIWRVSNKLGIFVLNGRQVHQIVLGSSKGNSEHEKFFGLDYSPEQTNFQYLRKHPEELRKLDSNTSLIDYSKRFVLKFNNLYHDRLGAMIGPFGLFLFGLGLLSLFESRQRFEIFLILTFIAFNLLPDLITPQVVNRVVIRHIAIIIPIIAITEGIGISYLSNRLLKNLNSFSFADKIIPYSILFILLSMSAWPIYRTFKPPIYNSEYSPAEIIEPIRFIKEYFKKKSIKDPLIASERSYISYFSGTRHIYLPYTDYQGLVKFCYLNKVDIIYLKYKRIKNHPFVEAFTKKTAHPDFHLIYGTVDAYGEKIQIFNLNHSSTK